MNSLKTDRVAAALARLYEEAETADRPLLESFSKDSVNQEEFLQQFIEKELKEYKVLYQTYAGNFLNITPEFGRFLYMCARTRNAKRIVEFGSSLGISGIHLASALRDNGGGQLIGTDLVPTKIERARENLDAAGLADVVEFRVGDALETLKEIDGPVDMVLLDGAFSLYLPVLKLLEPHLCAGALIIGENAFEPEYLGYVRNPQNGYFSQPLPFDPGRGNEFSVVTG